MTYKELQAALKQYRDAGIPLQVKLNAAKDILQAELLRIEPTAIEPTAIEPTAIEPTAIEPVAGDTIITKTAKLSAWAVHTGRQLFTLLTLIIVMLHQWDMELTNHPNTKLAQARISQVSSFIGDVIKWQLKAQLGTNTSYAVARSKTNLPGQNT